MRGEVSAASHEARGLLSAYLFGHLAVCAPTPEVAEKIRSTIDDLVNDVVEAAIKEAGEPMPLIFSGTPSELLERARNEHISYHRFGSMSCHGCRLLAIITQLVAESPNAT